MYTLTYTFRVYHTTILYSACIGARVYWTYACARVWMNVARQPRARGHVRTHALARVCYWYAARVPCARLCGVARATCHGTLLHKSNSRLGMHPVCAAARVPPGMDHRCRGPCEHEVRGSGARRREDDAGGASSGRACACMCWCARALGQPVCGHGSRAAPGSLPGHNIAAGRPAWLRPWLPRSFGLVA